MADQDWVEVGKEEAEKTPDAFVSFKTIGDTFTGKYIELQDNVQGTYGPETHYIFLTKNDKGEQVRVTVNANPDLRKRLSVIAPGDFVRIIFAGTKDIGKPSPMKLFQVLKYQGKVAAPAATPPPAVTKPAISADVAPF